MPALPRYPPAVLLWACGLPNLGSKVSRWTAFCHPSVLRGGLQDSIGCRPPEAFRCWLLVKGRTECSTGPTAQGPNWHVAHPGLCQLLDPPHPPQFTEQTNILTQISGWHFG